MVLVRPGRAQRILIVDDEPTLIFFLKQELGEYQTLGEVEAVSCGEEALTKLSHHQYDLLITDLKMPDISGLTLIKQARTLYPDISVILMTAFGSDEVHSEATQLEIEGYLTKPFSIIKLRDMVIKILGAKNKNQQNLVGERNSLSTP